MSKNFEEGLQSEPKTKEKPPADTQNNQNICFCPLSNYFHFIQKFDMFLQMRLGLRLTWANLCERNVSVTSKTTKNRLYKNPKHNKLLTLSNFCLNLPFVRYYCRKYERFFIN